jgi:hypothetical protein
MDLLQHIRNARAGQRRKRVLTPTLFDRVSSLVKEFTLDERFLRRLDESPDEPGEGDLAFDGVKPKRAYEPPLFSLCTEAEYRVTMAIIHRLGDGYLGFASSPGEILLCRPLFLRNPSLPAERLARFHFETLLLADKAQDCLRHLTEELERLRHGGGFAGDENPQVSALQARLEAVRRIVARLEEAGCR